MARRFTFLSAGSTRAAAIAIGGLVTLFVALLVFSMWQASRATNFADASRTRSAIRAVVENEIATLQGVNTDNAFWDDPVLSVVRSDPDLEFIRETWGMTTDPTSANTNYDTSIVFDEHDRVIATYFKGQLVRADASEGTGAIFKKMAARIKPGEHSASGLVATADGPRLVTVTQIKPLSEQLQSFIAGKPCVFLGFSRPVSAATLAKISRLLAIKGVRVAGPNDKYVAEIPDPEGRIALRLAWDSEAPGRQVIFDSLPVLLAGLAVCLVFAGFMFRFAARLLKRLRNQALVDALSHLPNRRAIQLKLQSVVQSGENAALAFIDLDGFKGINDNYGHGVGDALIRECSTLISSLSKDCTMVARLGGDEFAVLATGAKADERLKQVAESFISRLEKPFKLGDRTVMIGASVGLAFEQGGNIDASELMRQADFAMYSAKTSGKMQISWFNPVLDERQAQAHAIEMRLRERLAQGAFSLEYQPIVDAKSHRVKGAEALIRWGDDPLGTLSPDEFVPVAEATGLIDGLGRYVLLTACREAIAWDDVMLSVNVSPAQLRNPHFPETVRLALAETGFPADRLEIEVTETYVITNPDFARAQFEAIRALGVRIALDDFGTGYASVGYLRQFKFDKLKLDRSLVCDAMTDDTTRTLLNASIVIAHSLDMSVVAEGVETFAQAQLMNVAGSDQLQGWHFSHSLTPAAMTEVLAQQIRKDLSAEEIRLAG